MQKKHISYLNIFMISLVALFGGCKKEKSKSNNKPFFSKMKENKSSETEQEKPKSNDSVDAFDLNDDEMKTFALNDKLDKHQSSETIDQQPSNSKNLFSWEQLAQDENKNEFKKLFFKFNIYTLDKDQQKNLDLDIKLTKKLIDKIQTIIIEGHACHSEGSIAYNMALSEKRARHVKDKFVKAGINPDIIKVAPRGQEMPIKKGGNREEQAVNRRVEIFVINKDQSKN